jgi:hypothetical protein
VKVIEVPLAKSMGDCEGGSIKTTPPDPVCTIGEGIVPRAAAPPESETVIKIVIFWLRLTVEGNKERAALI